MKLSSKNWIIRELYDRLCYDRPRSLCALFWKSLIIFTTFCTAAGLFGIIVGKILLDAYVYLTIAPFGQTMMRVYAFCGFVLTFILVLWFPVSQPYVGVTKSVKNMLKFNEEGSVTNLISQWLKAKKDKVCPIITYEEGQ